MSGSALVTGFQNQNAASGNPPISEDPNSSDNVKPVSIFSNDYKKYLKLNAKISLSLNLVF